MKWSRSLIPTLRENPSDAETASHRLMLRAGLIRKVMAGVYAYLPLGWRSLRRVMEIVRQEMNRAGAVELFMPVLQPTELWQETGRLAHFGPLMCKFQDRNGRWNVLGPTHEEVITFLVRSDVKSYRQLPITLYQIQTKFRDEIRPRFGVIRSREFIMKDAYSFDTDLDGMGRSYQAQYDAYCRIFSRAGLDFVPVEADTGLMGGDVSHEFMVPSPTGEDLMSRCPKCGYAANREKVECPATGETSNETALAIEEVSTPRMSTVEQVSKFVGVPAASLLKTMIVRTDQGFMAAVLPGDAELNPAKLARILMSGTVELATEEEIEKATGGPIGFSGPVGLTLPVIADHSIRGSRNCVTGANRRDLHLKNVNPGRDFEPKQYADIRLANEGAPCPKCREGLKFVHSIEVGHVFKLGTKYSAAMNAVFLDEKGQSRPAVMGCYGIGINRILASAIEIHHDEQGIQFPKAIAPADAHLVSINMSNPAVVEAAQRVYDALGAAGLEVLWDDRDATPGVKFSDADLLGVPIRVTVGSRTVKNGTVDVRSRATGAEAAAPLDGIVAAVQAARDSYPF